MIDPLRKPEGLNWNAASLELPEIPMLPAGQDALSATISAVLPTLAAPLAANVATLQAKEIMFSGKLGAAQAAYQNSDDAGSQSVGQIVGVLGQVGQQAGQMGQMAGAPAQAIGGQTGMFGSLMRQAVQGGKGGQDAGGGQPQQPRDDVGGAPEERTTEQRQEPQQHEREPLHRADDSRPAVGPVPVTPPEHHRGDDDFGRRM